MLSRLKKICQYSYWSNRITDWIYANVPQAQESEREKVEYGAYMALSEISKIGLILILAGLLKVFWYVTGIILLFGMLRWCLGGIHAKSHWVCTISYLCFVYGTLAVSLFFPIDRLILNILVIPFSIIVAYKYAPADMPVKPITSKRQRRRLRITGFILLAVLFILAQFLNPTWFNICMLIIALTSVLMTPLVYKITNNTYGGILDDTVN